MSKTVLGLEEVDQNDIDLVGVKGAFLGRLKQLGFNIPRGFVIASPVYQDFIRTNRIDRTINQTLTNFNERDFGRIQSVSDKITDQFLSGQFNHSTRQTILRAYESLLTGQPSPLDGMAVRSSIVSHNFLKGGLAGQVTSYLNVAGEEELLNSVKKIWAKLFSPPSILYRSSGGHSHNQSIAVVVQSMLAPEIAGKMLTLDPLTNDKSRLVVEAIWGLGETLSEGMIEADRYVINKNDSSIIEKRIFPQAWKISRSSDSGPVHQPIPKELCHRQKLSGDQLQDLAKIGQQLEAYFQFPQDIEWAIDNGQLYLLETKPITTVTKKIPVTVGDSGVSDNAAVKMSPLLLGTAGSAGLAFGKVKIVHSTGDLSGVGPNDILVAEIVSPDYILGVKHARGLITDFGGKTSHAAMMARELGIPAVVGTGNAACTLQDGQLVTLDGFHGKVYRGKINLDLSKPEVKKAGHYDKSLRTATKVYANLSNPVLANRAATESADGVGLLRSEFIISQLGVHPQVLIDSGRSEEFITKLADKIEIFAQAFHPNPVVYRSSDFKTTEYRSLNGGDQYEEHEENPMIGLRGAARYLSNSAIFQAEVQAIKDVRGRRGYANVWLMIPFVRTILELEQIKQLIDKSGLSAQKNFKLWMMCEVPSNVFLIEDFLKVGIDGVSIDTSDLTQLILGVDRDNNRLEGVFDERNPAVMKAIEIVIDACRKHHKPISICGQAVSLYPEFTQFLVHKGVTSVSVDVDSVWETKKLIASIEHQLHRNDH